MYKTDEKTHNMDTKQKYVRLREYDQIIIFHQIIQHSDFKDMDPVSAGFCHVHKDEVVCFGESISLKLKSQESDTFVATKQIFGWDAMEKLK
ncbi:hypothetical protein N9933_03465 [bacterium]|nr:hypothetical protein [bacterium]